MTNEFTLDEVTNLVNERTKYDGILKDRIKPDSIAELLSAMNKDLSTTNYNADESNCKKHLESKKVQLTNTPDSLSLAAQFTPNHNTELQSWGAVVNKEDLLKSINEQIKKKKDEEAKALADTKKDVINTDQQANINAAEEAANKRKGLLIINGKVETLDYTKDQAKFAQKTFEIIAAHTSVLGNVVSNLKEANGPTAPTRFQIQALLHDCLGSHDKPIPQEKKERMRQLLEEQITLRKPPPEETRAIKNLIAFIEKLDPVSKDANHACDEQIRQQLRLSVIMGKQTLTQDPRTPTKFRSTLLTPKHYHKTLPEDSQRGIKGDTREIADGFWRLRKLLERRAYTAVPNWVRMQRYSNEDVLRDVMNASQRHAHTPDQPEQKKGGQPAAPLTLPAAELEAAVTTPEAKNEASMKKVEFLDPENTDPKEIKAENKEDTQTTDALELGLKRQPLSTTPDFTPTGRGKEGPSHDTLPPP